LAQLAGGREDFLPLSVEPLFTMAIALPTDDGTTERRITPELRTLQNRIRDLARRKNAVILAHIYQRLEVQ